MRLTELLMDEHQIILRVLDVIEKVDDAIEQGAPLDGDLIDRILDFASGFADRFHHQKEEDLLIPVLEAHGMSHQGSAIGLVLQDHGMARYRIKKAREALPLAVKGDEEALEYLRNLLRMYARLVRNHIHMEDRLFFKQADQYLSEEEQAELEKKNRRKSGTKAGVKLSERYRSLAKRIETAATRLCREYA